MRKRLPSLLLGVLLLVLVNGVQGAAQENSAQINFTGPHWQYFSKLKQAGFVLANEQATPLKIKNGRQFYVPASTTKLITALLAIEHWGLEHRFQTEFYLRQTQAGDTFLLVKGYGDPYLVSEELIDIAKQLQPLLAEQTLAGIMLDTSYYESALLMPGTSKSLNPYDAIPSALAANFNTINVVKKHNQLYSAEPQTPLVSTGAHIVKKTSLYQQKKPGRKFRINLGDDVKQAQQYFAELFAEFLQQQGVSMQNRVEWGNLNSNDRLILQHANSRNLADIIKPMMKYSTNFIANQLALNLSAELQGAPANQLKVKQSYQQMLQQHFAWQDFLIEEGAGLSRKNRLAPNQLIDVLQAFKPYVHLLPEVEQHVFAKSGSLIGVSTLAGYIDSNGQLYPFAMMINEKVPYRFRNKLAKEISQISQ